MKSLLPLATTFAFALALSGCTSVKPDEPPYHEFALVRLELKNDGVTHAHPSVYICASPAVAGAPGFEKYAGMVAKGLALRGMNPVGKTDAPDLIVALDYGMSAPEEIVHRERVDAVESREYSNRDVAIEYGRPVELNESVIAVKRGKKTSFYRDVRWHTWAKLTARDAKVSPGKTVWLSEATRELPFEGNERHLTLLIAAATAKAGENADETVSYEMSETSEFFKKITGSWTETKNPSGQGVFRIVSTVRIEAASGTEKARDAVLAALARRGIREAKPTQTPDAVITPGYDDGESRLTLDIRKPGDKNPIANVSRIDHGWFFTDYAALAENALNGLEIATEGY